MTNSSTSTSSEVDLKKFKLERHCLLGEDLRKPCTDSVDMAQSVERNAYFMVIAMT